MTFKPRTERAETEIDNAVNTLVKQALADQNLIKDDVLDTLDEMIARLDEKLTIQVNEIIGRTVDAVQDTVVEAYTPRLDLLDRLMGPVDEWLVSKMIGQWREEVWQTAVALLNNPTEKERIYRQMEARSLKSARILLAV